jgi:hypothetical protein
MKMRKVSSPIEPAEGSSKSLNDRHTHTGIFMPKDSGVFPPIKGNVEERYQNFYLDKPGQSPSKK